MIDNSTFNNALAELVTQVRTAVEERSSLSIEGGGSKHFLGRLTQAPSLSTKALSGIVSYEPTELVLTALGGTPLTEIEAALRENGQMLVFEPPHFGSNATLGGAVASGLSGPRRPYGGAARDFVLGTRVLNGKGDVLAFGGQVMKNVAGYDVSRLMTGALGSLGVLVEVSLKVLPIPGASQTLGFDMSADDAIAKVNEWAGLPIPLAAACHDGERLRVRIEGTPRGVAAAAARLGGECEEEHPSGESGAYWLSLREQTLEFFDDPRPLWRLSVAPATPLNTLPGALLDEDAKASMLIDWGGGLRWLKTDLGADKIRAAAAACGGHALAFRNGDRTAEVFHPLQPKVLELHQRLKRAFDPQGIFNPGRYYRDL